MRALEPGSCVCLYTSLGEVLLLASVSREHPDHCSDTTWPPFLQLVTVLREGKNWVLHGVLAPHSPGDDGKCPDLLEDLALNARLQPVCKPVQPSACR